MAERRSVVICAIEDLPPGCREVFRLRKFEDLSQRDIAMRLKISENTVEKQLARALRLLLTQIAADNQNPALPPERGGESSENESEFYDPP